MLNIVAVLLSFDPNQSARSSFVGNTSIWLTLSISRSTVF